MAGAGGPARSSVSWWREAVIYQIYVRSFADGDGDGIGDLKGIRSRLPAVRELGVDAVWITPFYPSPQADGGYDVSDYRDVDPRFGSLVEFDQLLRAAHDLGLRVIIDLVPNHTSDQHEWFRAALATAPGSAERNRYIFRDGRGPTGDEPPNDWVSVFGGGAWTRVPGPDGQPGQWYLHLFAPEQPDLDWTNDEVREEFLSILRFWLDRGVDGFRIDVAHGLAKDPALTDLGSQFEAAGPAAAGHPHWDRVEVHDVYRSWRKVTNGYRDERVFVAEAWVADPDQVARYARPDELHTAFNFNFLLAPWDAPALRSAIDESITSLAAVGAPPTWVLSNHDVVRHVTRYGGGEEGTRRARAAILLMLALPGSAYLYQGEELGLPEVTDLPDEVLQDPTARSGGTQRGRDGCRVPIPWWGEEASYGFGPGTRSWLPQPAAWAELSAERQAADPSSMRTLYRAALRARRASPALGDGSMTWIGGGDGAGDGGDVLAFSRDPDFACVVNFGPEVVTLDPLVGPDHRVLLASGPLGGDGGLPTDTAAWINRAPPPR